jgi:Icc protein
VTLASLQKVLTHFQASAWPADLVAATGDLVQDDSAEAYERFCELTATLELPVYCLPGNHDIRPLMKDALRRTGFHYCEDVQIGTWLVINVDSCVDGSAGGCVSQGELDRLKLTLDQAPQSNILVALHHPPVELGSKWLDGVGLSNANEFMVLVTGCAAVRGVLFGHAHQDFDAADHGKRIIGTPSTCRQFKPGSDNFAVDDSPPAYRRITLHDDGAIDSELMWVE